MSIPVSIKRTLHSDPLENATDLQIFADAGKKHDLLLDPSQPPIAFKQLIHQSTGVEPSKQKVLVKGGQLKDDADWGKLGIKPVRRRSLFCALGGGSDRADAVMIGARTGSSVHGHRHRRRAAEASASARRLHGRHVRRRARQSRPSPLLLFLPPSSRH